MKFHFLTAALVFCSLLSSLECFPQKNTSSSLTPEEKAAADKLSEQFIQRLIAAGDVEPLIGEMFVTDFVKRLSLEAKHHRNSDDMWPDRTLPISDKTDLAVFENASLDEMRQFFVGRFRLMNYGIMVSMNLYARSQSQGTELADDSFDTIYPSSVMKRLENDPYLGNLILKKNLPSRPIATIEDLRNVNKTLSEVSDMLRSKENAKSAELTKEAIKMIPRSRQIVKEKFDYPLLNDIPGEHFGFPKGTRLIVAFASVGHMLVITKVGSEYKIVYAGIGSPD